ncbi:hypothetical protein G9A89_002180 [Geosiphon pyriformis]|nr:hypothetical protein G9A89_002180 [Geosiphon pyriformis]
MSFQKTSITTSTLEDQQLRQISGPQQSIKAFLYFAVISVFMKASMVTVGPYQGLSANSYLSSYEQSVLTNKQTNSLFSQGLTFSHDEIITKSLDQSINVGIFGVLLTSTAALLNGWA